MPTVLFVRRLGQTLAAGLAVWACVAAVAVVVPAARADLAIIHTRWQIDQWATGKAKAPGIVAWGKARDAVAHALTITPDDPQLHEHMAYLYASRAQQARAWVPELADTLMAEALLSYQQAVALRPMDGALWANIAQAHHALQPIHASASARGNASATANAPTGPKAAELWQAFDKAMAYGQREPSVQATLANVGFARWAELPEARRNALQAMVDQAASHALPAMAEAAKRHGREDLLPTPGPSYPTDASGASVPAEPSAPAAPPN